MTRKVGKQGSPLPPKGVRGKSSVSVRIDRETVDLVDDARRRLKLRSRGEALAVLLEVYRW